MPNPTPSTPNLTSRASGVDAEGAAQGLKGLLGSLRRTIALRPAGEGRVLLDFGHYANVIQVGGTGLAISTDGVGSKILVAEMAGAFDTLGIDLIAMNVNDLLCVGAEPLAMVDYIAVRRLEDRLLADLGRGLLAGAVEARITIPAGELAQLPDMLIGPQPDQALDLVGTAVGVVHPDRLVLGDAIASGDLVFGFAATGLHSNGYTLARRVLLDRARLALDRHIPELGRTLAAELLAPTRIYVGLALDLLGTGQVHGFAHITGDGIRNLLRLNPGVSYDLSALPAPPPIFALIAAHGPVAPTEMYATFNMGIGFIAVVAPAGADQVAAAAARHGIGVHLLGTAVADGRREIRAAAPRFRATLDAVVAG